MAEAKVYKDDVGLIIDIDMDENISTATGLKLYVKKPDGTTVEWTPSLYGTDYLRYTTSSGDLDQKGEYAIQPYFTLGSWTGKGDTVKISVYDSYG